MNKVSAFEKLQKYSKNILKYSVSFIQVYCSNPPFQSSLQYLTGIYMVLFIPVGYLHCTCFVFMWYQLHYQKHINTIPIRYYVKIECVWHKYQMCISKSLAIRYISCHMIRYVSRCIERLLEQILTFFKSMSQKKILYVNINIYFIVKKQ